MLMLPAEMMTLLSRRRFIAEVRTETSTQAIGVIDALSRGGISVFEISTAIPGFDEILRLNRDRSDVIVGVGDVFDTATITLAARSGAQFIASPVCFPDLITACHEQQTLAIMGALTPTEIIAAQRAGSDIVKVFPVSSMGGSQYIRSLLRHFIDLNVIASSGITPETLPEYLPLPLRGLALSSSLTPKAVIERRDWSRLSLLAAEFVGAARQWEMTGAVLPTRTHLGYTVPPDTVMAPVTPQMPAMQPPQVQSQPPLSPQHPVPSTPAYEPPPQQSRPVINRPGANDEDFLDSDQDAEQGSHSFRPWDSRPAPQQPRTGDDWIR